MTDEFDKSNIVDIYSLSPLQEAIYSYRELNPFSGAYHCQMSYRVKGDISIALVERSFQEIVNRYEVLRSVFINHPNGLLQVSLRERKVSVHYEDIFNCQDQEEYIERFRLKDKQQHFDLKKDILMRLTVLSVSHNEFEFIWSYHHILLDGWSSSILLSDYNNIYHCLAQELPLALPIRRPFKDYITWLSGKNKFLSQQYWKDYLHGFNAVTSLSALGKASAGSHFRKKEIDLKINREETAILLKLAAQLGITLNTMLQSAWSILISVYTGKTDIIFGSVVSGRPPELEGVEAMVGLFINTIPVRVQVDPCSSIRSLFLSVHSKSSNHAFHNLPFGEIHSQASLEGVLFDHIIVFENYPEAQRLDGVGRGHNSDTDSRIITRFESSVQNNYDFYLNISQTDEMLIHFNYNVAVFDDIFIISLRESLYQLLSKIVECPDGLIGDLSILDSASYSVIRNFGRGELNGSLATTVHGEFDRIATINPDSIALVYGTVRLSYREVKHQSDCIAGYLQSQGVHVGDIIGLIMDPGVSMWVSILGILKSGCAYLPLDPHIPSGRLQLILKDSCAKKIIVDSDVIISVPGVTVYSNILFDSLYNEVAPVISTIVTELDLCYVIYTSGSTGTPKGVMITHGNILNYSSWFSKRFGINSNDSSVLTSSYSFDLGYSSVYPLVLSGGTVHFLVRDQYVQTGLLLDYIQTSGITYLKMTPTLFSTLIGDESFRQFDLSSLRLLLLGGESIRLDEVKMFQTYHGHLEVVNHYGPTETTVGVITDTIESEESLYALRTVIGRPIYNTEVLIVDTQLRVQPLGIPGEICIGGKSVGRGYLNAPEQTARQFLFHNDSGIIYRTGDRGRMLADGRIEYLGRTDHQFKIRGYRVDLREIEQGLLTHPAVAKAVVLPRSHEGVLHLCGFVVLHLEKTLSMEGLRAHALEFLPSYMIPVELQQVVSIPMKQNGKIDTDLLLHKQMIQDAAVVVGKTETILCDIWKQVLGLQHVGVDDNFFTIGGDSIKAIKLAARINKEFNIRIPLPDIFDSPTIRHLSIRLEKVTKELSFQMTPTIIKQHYALSSAQGRMYFLQSMMGDSTVYNMPQVVGLEGVLDFEKIQKTFEQLIQRHESLRTGFTLLEGTPYQEIMKTVDFSVERYDATESEIDAVVSRFIRPFDLSLPPLIRAGIIRINPNRHVLMIDVHHIISDGESLKILIKDFTHLFAGGSLPTLRFQYKDYSEWLLHARTVSRIQTQQSYWEEEFKEEVLPLKLPLDFLRPPIQTYHGKKIAFELDTVHTKSLKLLADQNECTLFTCMLSIYTILLHKLSGNEEIVIGTPALGRGAVELESIVGLFVNSLAIKNVIPHNISYRTFLLQVKNKVIQAIQHQDYPYEKLVEVVAKTRDMGRNPLFDTMFTLKKFEQFQQTLILDGVSISSNSGNTAIAKFDLTLDVVESGDILLFQWEYNTDLFKEATIERWNKYLFTIINEVVVNENYFIHEFSVLTDQEHRELLVDFNNTFVEMDPSSNGLDLFLKNVYLFPDKIAVVDRDQSITYRELDDRSSRLASYLIEKGITACSFIGILSEKNIEVIIGIWAVIKTGNSFFTLDISYPILRIQFMIENAGCKTVLTTHDLTGRLVDGLLKIIIGEEQTYDHSNVPLVSSYSNDVAYLVYTSGSTGLPKAVIIEHRGWCNASNAWRKIYKLDTFSVRLLQLVSISFDVFCGDIARSLLNGGTLILANEEVRRNPDSLFLTLRRNKINLFEFTPGVIVPFLEYVKEFGLGLPDLRLLIFGSEPFYASEYYKTVIDFGEAINIANSYGVSEATIDSAVYICQGKIGDSLTVPIGKPIDNTKLYILDRARKIVPIGVVGELYIGGEGVARGYLNQVELTHEKFVVDPYEKGKKLYRTGDYARWHSDGNVEFLGRLGTQVKIRGYRIELSEIENTLLKHPQIKAALIDVIEDQVGGKHLIGFVVYPVSEDLEKLKTFLKSYLPLYMIPELMVRIDLIPLTTSGKVNRDQLRSIAASHITSGSSYVVPQTQLQKEMVLLWEEVLGISKVGVANDFFELGGNSLAIIKLISIIHASLNKKLNIIDFFEHSTVEKLTNYIESIDVNTFVGLQIAAEADHYPLGPAQRRLYILQQMDLTNTAYNITDVMMIEGDVDFLKVKQVFESLVLRHDSLRSSIIIVNDEPCQRIEKKYSPDIRFLSMNENELELFIHDFISPFELQKSSHLRIALVQIEQQRYVLLVDMHHIISDGVSHEILMRDFIKLYNGIHIEPLRLQYKDYVMWQQHPDQQSRLKLQEKFWLREYELALPLLELPTDFNRPTIQRFEGRRLNYTISARRTKDLHQLARSERTTLFTLMLGIYYVLLHKLTGQEDIVVGTPVVGRRHVDLNGIVGIFVNMLALRNFPEGQLTFKDFLGKLKFRTLSAFENQEYEYEDLVEKVVTKRDLSRNPIFSTVFTLGEDKISTGDSELDFKIYPYGKYHNVTSKFDIAFHASTLGDEINISIEYATSLFTEARIVSIVDYYCNIIDIVAKDSSVCLQNIDMLSGSERRKVIYEFNDTQTSYNEQITLSEIFEKQVFAAPDLIACSHDLHFISYGELNARVNQVARALRNEQIGASIRVGIMMNRRIEMIIAMMAVLKAGGIYVPVEPDLPRKRIERIFDSVGVRCVITNDLQLQNILAMQKSIASLKSIVSIDTMDCRSHQVIGWEAIKANAPHNLKIDYSSDNIAYIIHTSGSTGLPKGVSVKHQPVVNLIEWITKKFDITSSDKILFVSSISFDLSVYDVFGILACGGTVCIASEDAIKDGRKLLRAIAKECITFWDSAPAALQQIVPWLEVEPNMFSYQRLRLVFQSGDWIPVNLHDVLRRRFLNAKLIALGGATEAAVWSNFYPVERTEISWRSIPYGKPIQNVKYFILDGFLNPCPIGVSGDLYIGGECLASGYINEPELTARKFILDPFHKGKIIYRTGDCARWFEDGNIEFLGRKDSQVKIRGMRIELGEIQNHLLRHPDITDTVVLTGNESDDKFLIAYYIAGEELSVDVLKAFLINELPQYMIPSYFIRIDSFPVTANGKLDRKALPAPSIFADKEHIKSTNETERILLLIFSELLNIEDAYIGIESDFFELGGHSLKATQLLLRISKVFSARLDLRDIFLGPTVRDIAKKINSISSPEVLGIEVLPIKDYYELSHAQQGVWISCQRTTDVTAFNVSMAYQLEGIFDEEALKSAFKQMITRYEILRTTFPLIEGVPRQKIHQMENYPFEIKMFDLFMIAEAEINAGRIRKEFEMTSFDLTNGPLLRVGLVKMKTNSILIITLHHIITDGWSVEIMFLELIKLYKSFVSGEKPLLIPLKIQYKDYSAWHNKNVIEQKNNVHAQYWLKQFEADVPILNLPTDGERSVTKVYSSSRARVELLQLQYDCLRNSATQHKTTLFTLLLTLIEILLYKYSGQEDMVIGIPVAGRNQSLLDDQVGLFVNILPLRIPLRSQDSFNKLCDKTKHAMISSFNHQAYPFDQLLHQLDVIPEPGRYPLFDVMVNYHVRSNDQAFKIDNLKITPLESETVTSKYDASFNFFDDTRKISLTIEYNAGLFSSVRMQQMCNDFMVIIDQALLSPDCPIVEFVLKKENEEQANEEQEFLQSMRDI